MILAECCYSWNFIGFRRFNRTKCLWTSQTIYKSHRSKCISRYQIGRYRQRGFV